MIRTTTRCSIALALTVAAHAGAQIYDDALTTYVPSSASSGQDIRPLVEQRGVFVDGAVRSSGVHGWVMGRLQVGEAWNGHATLPSGLALHTGTYTMTDVHLALPADVPWIVGVSYNARQETNAGADRDSDGPQGKNWFQMSQPEMVYIDGATDADDMVYIIYGADRFVEFRRLYNDPVSTNIFTPVNGAAGVVIHSLGANGEPDTWTYSDPSGHDTVFFGGNTASNKADWQVWKVTDAAGNVAFVGHSTTPSTAVADGYTTDGNIALAYDSADRRFSYTYSTVAGSKVLTQVKAETKTGGTWASPTGVSDVGKVDYDYYVDADSYGGDRDLKTVTITTPMTDSGVTNIREKYFRYWEGAFNATTNPGTDHLIQYVVDYEGVRKLDWADSLFDDDHFTVSETILKPYANAYFEYDSDRRIVEAWFNGECGCSGANDGTYSITYETDDDFSSSAGYDTAWRDRTVLGQPDGTFITQYFDETGGPLSRVTTDSDPAGSPTKTWGTKVVRDSDGYVEAIHTPANLSSYTHDDTGGGSDGGTLSSSASVGLIREFARFSTGNYQGYVQYLQEREGTTGTLYYTGIRDYETLSETFSDAGEDYTVYRVIPGTRETLESRQSSVPTADYDVEATVAGHGGSDPLAQKSVQMEQNTVSTANNGDGATVTSTSYYLKSGRTAFRETPDGIFNYSEYTNGQLTKQIRDVDLTGTFPSGSDPNTDFGITESSSGNEFELTTTMTYDAQGRPDTVTAPDGQISKNYYTVLADRRLVVIRIPRIVSGTTFHGPASISVMNHAGKAEFSGTIALPGGSTTSALTNWIDEAEDDPIEALGVGSLFRVSTSVYDEAGGQLTESRSYYDIPSALPGNEGTHYDATVFGYDANGRRVRVKDATGTITRTEYDELGRVIETHVGRNDNSFAGGEPSGTDDMVKTQAMEYDGGSAGGNSHLTKRTAFVVDGTTGQRVTEFVHDERGRTIVVKNPQAPHVLSKYDDKNRVIATATYSATTGLDASDDPESLATNRLSLSKTSYDERDRVWKTERFKINQSTGSKMTSGSDEIRLVTLNWYDDEGRSIKTVGSQISKTKYDRLGRATHRFVVASTDDTTYAHADDVAGDIVLSESQTIYESDSGLVIANATIDRLPSDYGMGETTGALDTNADADPDEWTAADLEGRIQISAMWYDDLDRVTDTVMYGTNGGSDFDRTTVSSAPTRSDTILRTTNTYNDDGTLKEVEDAKSLKTRYEYDDAGRQTKVIANYVDGTPGGGTRADDDQTITYTYTDGLRVTMTADLPSGQTDQTTTYTYGVTKGASAGDSAFSHGALLQKVTYPDSASGTDVVTYAYNAQGQQIYMKDQAGNVIETDYDTAGRVLHRRVTTLASGFDGDVRRITSAYTSRGQIDTLTQYDNATAGSGSVVNEVEYSYDEWGRLTKFAEDHDSAVTGSGNYYYDIDYTYALAHEYDPTSDAEAYRVLRRTGMTMPDGTSASYEYSSAGSLHDDEISRVTTVEYDSVDVATYDYLGTGRVVQTYLDEAEVYSAVSSGTAGSFPGLDRFNRITTSSWTWDRATDIDLYSHDISYDRNSWIEEVEDTLIDRQSLLLTNDDLGRLVEAERGLLSAGSITKDNFQQEWDLGQTGNWERNKLDLNGDADYTDAGELDEHNPLATSPHFNAANELTARDTDNDGTDDLTLVYDAVGNLTDDGEHYDYVYDAFGRLREIRVRGVGTGALVAEYQYNALGHRISWHYDTTQSGGGEPDGTVDSNDPTFHFVHDERWRLVATYRNTDSDPKEQFLSHQAGLGGSGSSSYIDGVILRDDHDADWTAAADSTLERRIYYVQNWRADVVALLSDNGRILERVRYEPYGTPFGQPPMDFTGSSDTLKDDYGVPDGDVDSDDFTFFNDATTAGSARADLTESSDDTNATYGRPDGDRDGDDFYYYLDVSADNESRGRDVLSSSDLRNRKGYAGYEWDPGVQAGTPIYHIRNRVYMTDTGRWSRRDPMGYVDGHNQYFYSSSAPVRLVDPMGLCSRPACGRNWEQRMARPGEFAPIGPVLRDPPTPRPDDGGGGGGGGPTWWPDIPAPGTGVTPQDGGPPQLDVDKLFGWDFGLQFNLINMSGSCCKPVLGGLVSGCIGFRMGIYAGECYCEGINGRCAINYIRFEMCITFSAKLGFHGGCNLESNDGYGFSIGPPKTCPDRSSFNIKGNACLSAGIKGFGCRFCVSGGLECSAFDGPDGVSVDAEVCFSGILVTSRTCFCELEV